MNRLALIASLALAGSLAACGARDSLALEVLPSTVTIPQGQSGTLRVQVSSASGLRFEGGPYPLQLLVTGTPSGVTWTFEPTPLRAETGSSGTLTLRVAGDVAPGEYPMEVRATARATSAAAPFRVTVTRPYDIAGTAS